MCGIVAYMGKGQAKEGGVTGWKAKLPKLNEDKEQKEELLSRIRILDALLPEQRELEGESVSQISSAEKQRIAKDAEVSATDVNQTIKSYQSMANLRPWLLSRVERQLPLPTDQAELQSMMRNDQPKLSFAQKQQVRRQGQGRRRR